MYRHLYILTFCVVMITDEHLLTSHITDVVPLWSLVWYWYTLQFGLKLTQHCLTERFPWLVPRNSHFCLSHKTAILHCVFAIEPFYLTFTVCLFFLFLRENQWFMLTVGQIYIHFINPFACTISKLMVVWIALCWRMLVYWYMRTSSYKN
jgi:hypothetical protein